MDNNRQINQILEKFYKVAIREIEKGIEALPKERPYFGPLQVREVEEIQIGKSYY